jgi:hypothetical protein
MRESPNESEPYRVLAIDGGGVRGLYTATVLCELGSFFAKQNGNSALDLGRQFNLITGTSTGGILACALAAGVTAQEICALYQEKGPQIFSNPMPTEGFFAKAKWRKAAATQAANRSEPLKEALTEIFGGTTLGKLYADRAIALCVPSIKMVNQTPKVFKTPHFRRYVIDEAYTLVDVCLATSAAPIFLPLAALKQPKRAGQIETFVDGGLWANNPTLVGLIEALEICHASEDPDAVHRSIEVLSIGTCGLPEGDAPDAKANRGILDWLAGIKIAGLALNVQAAATAYMTRLLAQRISELGRQVRVVRIENPAVSADQAKHLQLDLATPAALSLLSQLGGQKAQEVMSRVGDTSDADGQFIRRISSPQTPRT